MTPAKLERLQRLGERWAKAHGVRPPETRVDLVAVLRPPRGRSVLEPRAGAGLMPVAATTSIALDGPLGYLVDVQADVSRVRTPRPWSGVRTVP